VPEPDHPFVRTGVGSPHGVEPPLRHGAPVVVAVQHRLARFERFGGKELLHEFVGGEVGDRVELFARGAEPKPVEDVPVHLHVGMV